MKNFEIYTDKAEGKVFIVTDENGLSDLRAACIAYCTKWMDKAGKETEEKERKNCIDIADKFNEYWDKLYDAGTSFKDEED